MVLLSVQNRVNLNEVMVPLLHCQFVHAVQGPVAIVKLCQYLCFGELLLSAINVLRLLP